MKKTPIFVGIALGIGIALFTTIFQGIGVKIVMMFFGAIAGAAVGGAIAGTRARRADFSRLDNDDDAFEGLGFSHADLIYNYWRDKGRLPLTEPLEAERGRHMFDPDH